MAAVLGVDPRRTGHDVWLTKTEQLLPPPEPSEAMIAGIYFEPAVLDWAEDTLGKIRRGTYRSAPLLHLGAHLDGLVIEGNEPVEVKTRGLFGPLTETWGEAGTDQVPDAVRIQAHVHMICLRPVIVSRCYVPAFLGGRGFQMFQVPLNNDLCEIISEQAVRFWEDHVIPRVPPSDSLPSEDVIKLVRREAGKIEPVPATLIADAKAAIAARMIAEQFERLAKKALLAAMGDAEIGDGGPKEGLATYFRQARRGIDGRRLRAERPEIAAEYTADTTYPVLRFKKG